MARLRDLPDAPAAQGRNAVAFTRRFEAAITRYEAGPSSFAALDASVQGWLNHVRYADTWGLRRHLFAAHPIRAPGGEAARGPSPAERIAPRP